MLRVLKSVTFVYVPREDRILAAINAGHDDAWSCWLTRRLALAVLERTTDYVASSSDLAQRAPAELRGEMAAFERDAAIAKTAPAMSVTTGTVLNVTAEAAELAERLTISQQANGFHFELRGLRRRWGGGARRAGGAATHVADAAGRDRQGWLGARPRRSRKRRRHRLQPRPSRHAIDDCAAPASRQDGVARNGA